MRTLRPLLALLVAVPVAVAPAAAAPPSSGAVAVLRAGRPAFWDHTATTPAPSRIGGLDWTFPLDVTRGGARLRVAHDHPDFRQYVELALYRPDGTLVRRDAQWMSGEITVTDPVPGRWTAVVSVGDPNYREFRMRALLDDGPPAPPAAPEPQLPNLRLVPPYEFSFDSSLNAGRQSAAAAGAVSCNADDMAQHGAIRCLRFSLGPENVGSGPMSLVFAPLQGLVTEGEVTQRVRWSDGSYTERPAGTFSYHASHMHYHHTGFGSLELFEVVDAATGELRPVGSGPKQGFCTGDVKIAQWREFANEPRDSAPSTCLSDVGPAGHYDPSRGTTMGLSAGWVDIYSWEQDGNYVEFPLDGAGRYVVRSTADAAGVIAESDETDNTGYSYIEVTGTTIRVLERGRGGSPWDPAKEVVDDGLHPLAR